MKLEVKQAREDSTKESIGNGKRRGEEGVVGLSYGSQKLLLTYESYWLFNSYWLLRH